MDSQVLEPRKELSADPLFALIRKELDRVPDPRPGSAEIPLGDALMSAFAMFSLKDKSLLAFEKRAHDPNMHAIYQIGRVPSDTRMREILDPVEPLQVRRLFPRVFRCLQRGKGLEGFVYWNSCYLLSIDATEYFRSNTVHCAGCLVGHPRNGKIAYSHEAESAAIVHPGRREVIPLCPEPVIRQSGESKNDCELNAAGRLLDHIRREHPYLGFIVVEDGLYSKAPHLFPEPLPALDLRQGRTEQRTGDLLDLIHQKGQHHQHQQYGR